MAKDIALKLKIPLFSVYVRKDKIEIVSPAESSAGAAVAVNLLNCAAVPDAVISIIFSVERSRLNIEAVFFDSYFSQDTIYSRRIPEDWPLPLPDTIGRRVTQAIRP